MSKTTKKHCRVTILMFLAIWLVISPAATAIEGPDIEAGPRTRSALQTKITRSWVGESIDKVLLDLAEDANVNIIKSPKVKGSVTARVTDVPLAEALANILAAHEFTYVATDNMIRVMPKTMAALAKGELVSKVYRISYADANEVAASLLQFVSDKGKVAFHRGTNLIAVTDTAPKIRIVDRFIAAVDRVTPQVLVDVKIYEVTTLEGFELDSVWRAARNAPLETINYNKTTINSDSPSSLTSTSETTETREEESQEYLITTGNYPASDDDYNGSLMEQPNPISQVPFQNRTVKSETRTVTEVPKTTYTDTITKTSTRLRRKPVFGGSFDRVRGGTLSFSLLSDAVDIELALSMLKSEVESKLLANPQILVLDNGTADFEIIREVPYTEFLQVGREDSIRYTEYKNIGVQLKVTPHIARDGLIKLHIVPEFSVLVGQDIRGVPTVDTRRVDTVALVRDGQTIAIGGLRKRQTSKQVFKVPVFGDIPIIGGLFRSTSESEEISELVIFITPRIISEPDMLAVDLNDKGDNGIPRAFGVLDGTGQDGVQVIGSGDREPRIAEDSPQVMTEMAYTYLKTQRFELAKEMLAAVIRRQPNSNTAYQYLGYCQLKLGDVDGAIESYRSAIELDGRDWEAHRGLGVAFMLKARSDNDERLRAQAVEQWRISLDVNPDQASRDALVEMMENYSN